MERKLASSEEELNLVNTQLMMAVEQKFKLQQQVEAWQEYNNIIGQTKLELKHHRQQAFVLSTACVGQSNPNKIGCLFSYGRT